MENMINYGNILTYVNCFRIIALHINLLKTLGPAGRNQEIDPETHTQEVPGTQVRIGGGSLSWIQPGVGAIDVLDYIANESRR